LLERFAVRIFAPRNFHAYFIPNDDIFVSRVKKISWF